MKRSTGLRPALIPFGLILLAVVAACASGRGNGKRSEPLRAMMESAIEKVKPALVRIHVVETDYEEGREVKNEAAGSGVIITPEGHIVTNHHVAGHAVRMFCTLATREEIEAELIATDPLADIAVIKLKPESPRTFPHASFGDSSKIRVGDRVLAMGSPLALSQSVTLGIVSNAEMILPRTFDPFSQLTLDGEDVGSLVRWIAHDADIFPGNSGGPLVNLDGEIMGINEISYGLSGAIPGNLAHAVAADLMKSGKVRRSWLGIEIQPLLKHSGQDRGALISGVIDDSPAAKAGLRSGDILLKLSGLDVTVRYDEDAPVLNQFVCGLPLDAEVPVVILRDGQEKSLTLKTAEREPARPKTREMKAWGITARNLSRLDGKELKRKTNDGVFVTSVRPGGAAGDAKPSINPADVIVSVDGEPIRNLEELVSLTQKLTDGKAGLVTVLAGYERKSERFVTTIKLGERPPEDRGLEVKKAWLPVATQVITRDIAQQLKRPELKGFRVTQVYSKTTVESGGFRVGDLITAVDGEKLEAAAPEDYEELDTLIRQYKVGSKVELTLLRETREEKISVELSRMPLLAREMKKYKDDNFDFSVRDICFFDRASEQWTEEQQGAIVEDVKSGGWAALGRLDSGDLIIEVDHQPVQDSDSVKKILEKAREAKPKSVVVRVLRGIHTVYLEIRPDWNHI